MHCKRDVGKNGRFLRSVQTTTMCLGRFVKDWQNRFFMQTVVCRLCNLSKPGNYVLSILFYTKGLMHFININNPYFLHKGLTGRGQKKIFKCLIVRVSRVRYRPKKYENKHYLYITCVL